MHRVRVIDSHTAGEPTRVVIAGAPDLGSGSMADRLARFRDEHDRFRSAVVNEPRGNDAIVGALLCEPVNPACACGVIFFNNTGYLHMCGHGTIGLAVTLAHLGRIGPGVHRIETPVGEVTAELLAGGEVEIRNVPSWRTVKDLTVEGPSGPVTGDVAWGGNWFFLTQQSPCPVDIRNLGELTAYSTALRRAVNATEPGRDVDHIEIIGPPSNPAANAKNFVLCPGGAYDRSPCGTGTSAKLACLHADSKLAPGAMWVQEGIAGGMFAGRIEVDGDKLIPIIRGAAWVNAEADLVFDESDPFCWGIRA